MNEDIRALRREIQQMREQMARLESRARQAWTQPGGQAASGNVEVRVNQVAHGFEKGNAVISYAENSWGLYDSGFDQAACVGVVSAVLGPDAFLVVLAGVADVVLAGADLYPSDHVAFTNGEAFRVPSAAYPPYEAGSKTIFTAVGPSSVRVHPHWYAGWQSHNGVFTTVTPLGSDTLLPGYYVVYAGIPAGATTILALADSANAWRWTNVGIAVCQIGGGGQWLVLTHGACSWMQTGIGDGRAAWQAATPWNAGQRIALSVATPGAYQTAADGEPAFKVYPGISSAGWQAAAGENPSAFTLTAHAVGQGVVYPIPASGGGTGTDVSALSEHSVLFLDTYGSPASRKIAGLLSATANYAVLVQKNSEQPTHLSLDLAANGSFVVNLGNLYAAAGGKRFATTAPTDQQVLMYDGSSNWEPITLIAAEGGILTRNATELVEVSAATATSVFGRAAGTTGMPAPIQATANNQILARISGSLQWLAAPSTSGHVLQYNGSSLVWGAVSSQYPGACAASYYTRRDASGTITNSSNFKYLEGVIVGGGGGRESSGGSATLLASGIYDVLSKHGGGGGTVVFFRVAVNAGESVTVTIGAAGSTGNQGGASSVAGSFGTIAAEGGYPRWGGKYGGGRRFTSSGSDAIAAYIVVIAGKDAPTQRYASLSNTVGFGDDAMTMCPDWWDSGTSNLIADTYGRGRQAGVLFYAWTN